MSKLHIWIKKVTWEFEIKCSYVNLKTEIWKIMGK
jgi:hypothetical protein